MKLVQEFRAFALKGNVIDLAVGVIIGGAFGKIVSSLVSDIMMPVLGFITAGVDIKELTYTFQAYTIDGSMTSVVLKWGLFVQSLVDFFIISLSIFLFLQLLAKVMKKKHAEKEEVATPEDILLLREIRDSLQWASR